MGVYNQLTVVTWDKAGRKLRLFGCSKVEYKVLNILVEHILEQIMRPCQSIQQHNDMTIGGGGFLSYLRPGLSVFSSDARGIHGQ